MGNCYARELIDLKNAGDYAGRTGFSVPQIQSLYQRFLVLGAETKGLESNQNPFLTSEDLMKLPQLSENPLAERIILSMYKERLPEDYYDLSKEVDEGIKTSVPLDQIQIPFESFVKAFARYVCLVYIYMKPEHGGRRLVNIWPPSLFRYRKPHDDPRQNNEFNSAEGKLKFIFGMFDMNEDRTVCAEEVAEVLKTLNPDLESEDAKKFTSDILRDAWADQQEKRSISFQEFVDVHQKDKVLRDMWFRFFP